MTRAVRIDCDVTMSVIDLPDAGRQAIQDLVGGVADQAVYHRQALLHIYELSAREKPLNLAAWVLASAWRGMSLYPLHGTIVVTGRDQFGEVCDLDESLVQQARAVVAMVDETVRGWKARPPASDDAAAQELLSYAAREIAAVG
jgi:hypothetical protein